MHVILLDSAFIPMSFVSLFRTGERESWTKCDPGFRSGPKHGSF